MNNSILFDKNDSEKLLSLVRKINIFSSLFVLIIGFIGNSLITYIYAIKKRCTNSSHVYLLFSSINDNLFLFVHLFEDTLKTYVDVYSIEKDHFLQIFNLVDMNDIQCQLINYLRNILRFISAYIVVVFTLQRLLIVYKPLTTKFKDTKSAWIIILIIVLTSILFNIWVPFIFKINNENNCDVDKKYSNEYFYLNLSYIVFVLLMPMTLVLINNILIFSEIKKSDIQREILQQQEFKETTNVVETESNKIPRSPGSQNLSAFLKSKRLSYKMSCNLTNIDELVFKKSKKKTTNNKLTTQLSIVSISFFILYLPYLIGWFIFYFNDAFKDINPESKNRIFSMLQIAEIFYIFYYGIKFYIFFFTTTEFKNIFTKTSKFIFVFCCCFNTVESLINGLIFHQITFIHY